MISTSFADICRDGNPKALIRHRKMPVEDLLYSMINRKGLTLSLELRNYMNISHPGTQISKPGYLKQRMKLNPEAFRYLYQYHNRNFYTDLETEADTYKGYLLLAVDGSNVNVPTNAETLEKYGTSSRDRTKRQAALGLACLYDVLNGFILDSDINRAKFNEMGIAEAQINRVRDTIGNEYPFLVLMDRGYPSIPAFMRMIDADIYFVARLRKSDYKAEQQSMKSRDEIINIELTEKRRAHYLGTEDEAIVMSRDSFLLRFVRVDLDESHYEVLATNLPMGKFPEECFAELYHYRWGIETAFEILKDRLQLENFTGTKPILLEQDIFSTIYVSNLAADIIRDVEKENEEKFQKDFKHQMKVNRSVSIGLLKNDLIYIILEPDKEEKNRLMQQLYDEISNNIVPVRPDRHYRRTKGQLAANYSNTHKRCF